MVRNSKKGFTLTELIVTVTLMGIVLIPVALMLNTVLRNYFKENDTMVAQQTAREIFYGNGGSISGVIEDMRKNDSTQISVYTQSAGGATAQAASGETGSILYIKSDLVYSFSGGVLHKKGALEEPDSDDNKVADHVIAFQVKRQDTIQNNALTASRIDLTVEVQSGSGRGFKLDSSYRIKTIH